MVEIHNKVEKIEQHDGKIQHQQDLSKSIWKEMEHSTSKPNANGSSEQHSLDMTDPYKTKESSKEGCPNPSSEVQAGKPSKIEQGHAESSAESTHHGGTESGGRKPHQGSELKEPDTTKKPDGENNKKPENSPKFPQEDNPVLKKF